MESPAPAQETPSPDPAAPADPAAPPPGRRRWRRVLGLSAGGLVLLLGVLALLLPTLLSSDFARGRVEAAASEAAARGVTIAGLTVGWSEAGLRDVVVRYGPAADAPVLLRVREVRCPAGITQAFASRHDVAPIEILGPEVRIDLRELARPPAGPGKGGAAGRPAPAAAAGAAPGPREPVPPFRVEVVVREGTLVLVDGDGRESRLGSFSAKVSASDAGPASLLLEADLGAAGRVRVQADATPFRGGVPLAPGDVEATVTAVLRSLDLAALRAAVAATPDLGIEELRGVVEASLEARSVAAAGAVEGSLTIEGRDIAAAGPAVGGRVEEPSLSLSAGFRAGRDGGAELRDAVLRVPLVSAKGGAVVAPGAEPTGFAVVEGRLEAVAARAIRLGLLPEAVAVAGDFTLQARAVADPTGRRVSGSLSIREAQISPGGGRPPLDEPTVDATFDVGMEGTGFRVHEAVLKSGSVLAKVEGFADRGGAADLRATATIQVARIARIATGLGVRLPGDVSGTAEAAASLKRGATPGPGDSARVTVEILDLLVTPPDGAEPVKDPRVSLAIDAVPGKEAFEVRSLSLRGAGAEVRASGRLSADGSSGTLSTLEAVVDLARADAVARAFGAAAPARAAGTLSWSGPVSFERSGGRLVVEGGEAVVKDLAVTLPAADGSPERTLREDRVVVRVDAHAEETAAGRRVEARRLRVEADGIEADARGALEPDGAFEGDASGSISLAAATRRAAALGLLEKDPAPRGSIRFDAGLRGKPGDEAVTLRRLEALDADFTLAGSGSASRKGPADLVLEFGADVAPIAELASRAGLDALPKGASGRAALKAEVRAASPRAPLAATLAASAEGLSFPDPAGAPPWTQKRVAFDGSAAFDRTTEVLTGEGLLTADDGTARVTGRAVLGSGAPRAFDAKAVVDLDLGGILRSRPDLLPLEGMEVGRAKGTVAAGGPIGGAGGLAGLEGGGRLILDFVRTDPMTLTAAEVDAVLKSGTVDVRSVKASVNGGAVTGRASLGISGEAPRHSLEVEAKGVQVDPAMAFLLKRVVPIFAVGEKGGVSGLLDATLALEGEGADWESARGSLRGKGRLRVAEGAVAGSGILGEVLEFLGGGAGFPFAAVEADFSVHDRAVWNERIAVDGKDHAMVLRGSTGFDGKLDYRVGARALRLGKKKAERLKPLLDEEGNLPFTLGGTLWKPKVKPPDLKKLAGNALEEAAKRKLKELLGGDDE